ncbi:hypothetical protein A2164_04430 [Candidatus Curtissbacteria bacterium RBG_13_35_7]|uniref:AlgX/AlgJ SGNH hydrolase-like domain-containing protein n=1 Tax=Candidatus Curtissbacteria bacterium RBG_13_35_7 TaxID=1797705 RepID=A0A1F5G4P9_9BACT|nr:MAG: hypothetical protein A2164_04430 [Candidatus Curtissbacteria bacterium RBG_13_35_7]
MIKTSADNIAECENKIDKCNERGNPSFGHNLNTILNRFSKRIQKKVQKILLALLGILVAFLLLEFFLRVSEKEIYDLSSCTSLDKNFHHVMIPEKTCRFKTDEWDVVYKINSLGLRDEEISQIKDVDELRILILGDSFVQGHGVASEKTFTKVLEKRFNQNGVNKFRLINSGVFGYSPLIEYLYLKKEGLNFKPDLIILAFDLTDFFEDRQRFKELKISYPNLSDVELEERIAKGEVEFNFEKINTIAAKETTSKIVIPSVPYNLKSWFRKNFKVYAKFADFVKKKNSNTQQDVINQGNIDKDIAAIMRGDKISDEDYQTLWQLPIENIRLIRDLLKKEGINFIVVGIPDAVQVSDQEWPGRVGLAYPLHFVDPRGPFQNKLSEELINLHVPFINMLDDFRQSKIFPLYFKNDGHWRETGHELAADIIYNILNTPNFYQLLNK